MNRLLGWTQSWRLWRALWGRIPEHPLMAAIKPKRGSSSDFGCSPLLVGGMLLLALPVMWTVGFSLALLAVVIGGTARGLAAAALTGRAVYQERGAGRFDLLGLTPAGSLGIGWVLALRDFRLAGTGSFINRYVQNAQRIIGIGAVAMVGLITFGTLIFQFDGVVGVDGSEIVPAFEYVSGALQLVVIVFLWLLTDNAQAPLFGVIVGIWSGLNMRRKPEAAAAAAGLYTAIQAPLFVAALLFWLSLSTAADGVRLGTTVLLMIVVREVLLRVLWSALCRHVNASGAELPAALRF